MSRIIENREESYDEEWKRRMEYPVSWTCGSCDAEVESPLEEECVCPDCGGKPRAGSNPMVFTMVKGGGKLPFKGV